MANKKVSQFTVVDKLSSDDIFLINQNGVTSTVGLSTLKNELAYNSQFSLGDAKDGQYPRYDASVKKWKPADFPSITTTNITNQTTSIGEGPVKMLGTPRIQSYSVNMAVLKNNRVIGFGSLNDNNMSYANVAPEFRQEMVFWTDDGDDYFSTSNAKVIDLQVSVFTQMALLDDGTVWLAGYNRFFGINQTVNTYTYGFRKVNFSDGAFIKSIWLNGDNDDGHENFAAISSTDNLYLWGKNAYGNLNTGNTTNVLTPTKVMTSDIVNNVLKACIIGTENPLTLVITKDGKAFACGYNGYGQMGIGNNTQQTTFVRCKISSTSNIENVVDFAISPWMGSNNIHLIKSDGTVWACGQNNYGQLGIGNTTDKNYFVQCLGLTNIVKVLGGSPTGYGCYLIAMDSSGGVWTWGYNGYGQLGLGNTTSPQSTPQKILASGASDIIIGNGFNSAGATGYIKNKKFYASGYRVFTTRGEESSTKHLPMHVDNVKNAIFYSGGSSPYGNNQGIIVLTEDGHLYGQGINYWLVLGASNTNTRTPRMLL